MQQYNTTPPKKSKKTLWIVLGVFVIVIALCVCSVSFFTNAFKSGTAVVSNSSNSQTSNANSSGNTVVALGKVITVDNVSCVATSAKILQPDQYNTPKQGNEFVVVHVEISNNGASDQQYNEFDFHVKSSSGNVTGVEVQPSSYTNNNILSSGTLAPGGKVNGDLIFQIPIGDSNAQVTWSASFFTSSSQYAWKLNIH